jgi:hypothetical protein
MARKQKIIATIDSETDPFLFGREPRPFCWGFYTDGDYQKFWGDDCTEQLIEYLTEYDDEELVIYAHNGGKFDFFFLLEYLAPNLKIINGRIAQANIGKHIITDSILILPIAMKQMDKVDIEYWKMEREHRETYKDEILDYLYYDCKFLHKWVMGFIDRFGRRLTLAGTAFNELKKTNYPITYTNETYDNKLRPFYYGGRVQCFETGEFDFDGEGDYVDINSAYPYAMLDKHWCGREFVEHFRLPEYGSYFAEIKAKSKGALPFRSEDGKLYFPDDFKERTFKVTGWEIQAGLETNTLEIVEIIRVYRPMEQHDFGEYVNRFYADKLKAEKDGDAEARLFAKLMLNSCYGKFGQDGRDFKDFQIVDFGDVPDGDEWNWHGDTETNHSIYEKPAPSDRFFNVATAASITGHVRAYLWKAICASETPLYCDTDSIICKKFHGKQGDQLGDWAMEANFKKAYIAQRKMYAMELTDGTFKSASKGVRLDPSAIIEGVRNGGVKETKRDAPAFNLKYGARFFTRNVNFENLEKNMIKNVDE